LVDELAEISKRICYGKKNQKAGEARMCRDQVVESANDVVQGLHGMWHYSLLACL
jgi:hypothetical protein